MADPPGGRGRSSALPCLRTQQLLRAACRTPPPSPASRPLLLIARTQAGGVAGLALGLLYLFQEKLVSPAAQQGDHRGGDLRSTLWARRCACEPGLPACDRAQLYVPKIPGVPDDFSYPPERYGFNSEVRTAGGATQHEDARFFHPPPASCVLPSAAGHHNHHQRRGQDPRLAADAAPLDARVCAVAARHPLLPGERRQHVLPPALPAPNGRAPRLPNLCRQVWRRLATRAAAAPSFLLAGGGVTLCNPPTTLACRPRPPNKRSYRGYGLSSGKPNEAGLQRDAQAALTYLTTQRRDVDASRVVVYGRSLGGAVALHLVAANTDKASRPRLSSSVQQQHVNSIRAQTRWHLIVVVCLTSCVHSRRRCRRWWWKTPLRRWRTWCRAWCRRWAPSSAPASRSTSSSPTSGTTARPSCGCATCR